MKNILYALIVVSLFGLSIWSLKKIKVIFFSFFFFFVTLLPYLNIIPISTLLADRYVFIASFSFCFLLGMVYREAGQYEAAISEWLKSMELAPHIINPYEELGNIYASRLNDLEKAKYYYLKGIEAAPKAKSRVEELRWMVQDLER